MYPLTIWSRLVILLRLYQGSKSSSDSADSQRSKCPEWDDTESEKCRSSASSRKSAYWRCYPYKYRLGMPGRKVGSNDLTSLKAFLDKNGDDIVRMPAITYGYSVSPPVLPARGADSQLFWSCSGSARRYLFQVSLDFRHIIRIFFVSTTLFNELPDNPSLRRSLHCSCW